MKEKQTKQEEQKEPKEQKACKGKKLSKEELAERKERKKGFFLFHKEVFLLLLGHVMGMLSNLVIYAAANGISIWDVFK